MGQNTKLVTPFRKKNNQIKTEEKHQRFIYTAMLRTE